jgi:cytochrome c oxidase assembly factor CtaG
MNVKLLSWIGMAACVALIISCFMPWAYYADSHIANEADRTFTGFYSFQQQYGRPGRFLVFFGVVILVLMILPKIWAKRTNLFLSAITVAYALKSYVLYTSCYNAYCPEKKAGIYIMIFSAAVMLIACVFPNMNIISKEKNKER